MFGWLFVCVVVMMAMMKSDGGEYVSDDGEYVNHENEKVSKLQPPAPVMREQ